MKTTAEALNEIEGFLLWEGEKHRARERAHAFASGLPWLTDSQRADLEQRYVRDQLDLSRACLVRIAQRSGELRAEYEAVYAALKRRLAGRLLACAVVACAALVLWACGSR
ncbi:MULTISPECIES: hypothetical protein [Streptomycetaceae]|uniref:Uncharacterized protein n=1 Tax=Streptantibioticus cattleyicolor (strain ATCC 35852 / DSM 46488 / JCM 4925 / NBRC 14057 / NRRL 8057) TaxID=1003195 RepID=F8JTZ2_STREN|nr:MULTISPECIES: hypothetical protein [Streptomycetaceae]AEW98090.1 hypothetical protein SCATT_57190 [Streptantibioticus cattleyicolor NRRL 8057 = DSM 46488]MYS62484.1 hypothetical protein [Streptomyces sp. SID5468]CCB78406.1 conserved protein of unknown function [Streptantibioticus cattleyicolor NRRL 8057 = DSM 46488]